VLDFTVVPGTEVRTLLSGREREVIALVESAYLTHHGGATVNPDSYFLRFPDKPEARIIALPAFLGGDVNVAGIKWIASFPRNIETGNPRASAVLVLNDYRTGYPVALLEAAGISAARTAASAALAATVLAPSDIGTVGIVGAGVIARNVVDYLAAAGVSLEHVRCHDLREEYAGRLATHIGERHGGTAMVTSLDEALSCDVVVLATTAAAPYIDRRFDAGQVVLNVSLRDLAPQVLLEANNVLDDVDHCLKADTSPHLAEKLTGSRAFVTGTLAEIIHGTATLDPTKATVFSPFGLGVLDLAVGHYVHQSALDAGAAVPIPDFFGETTRW
jgi:2,3-diaminopropionate biosynthesis protein SbnB